MCEIIKNSLTLSLSLMYDNNEEALIIMDNDPKHTSVKVKNVIINEKLHFLPNYPANSPDLNSLENLWEIWDREVHKHHPKNLDELDYWARIEWDNLRANTKLLEKLVLTYENRCNAVIKAKGQGTKY